MNRSRFFGTTLALAVTLSACSESPLGVGPAQIEMDELTTELALGSGTDDLRGSSAGPNALLERLAGQIPGFGGLYRTAQCHVTVVLTEGANVQEAVRIVHAAVEPLVERPCPDGIRVQPVRGEFTYQELRRFLLASRPLNTIPGVRGAYIDLQQNRLAIIVESRTVARRVAAALERVGIPYEAVVFRASPPARTISR